MVIHSPGAAAAASPSAAKIHRQRMPARTTTPIPPAVRSNAVPKSGWRTINSAGTPMISRPTATCRNRGGSRHRWKYQPSINGMAIFISSDGWKRNTPGTSSQRLEPFTVTPRNNVATSSRRPPA